MQVRLLADRSYRRTESIRWRGSKVGTVMRLESPDSGASYAVVEVSDRTFKEMEKSTARFILERGNVVEVYEVGK